MRQGFIFFWLRLELADSEDLLDIDIGSLSACLSGA